MCHKNTTDEFYVNPNFDYKWHRPCNPPLPHMTSQYGLLADKYFDHVTDRDFFVPYCQLSRTNKCAWSGISISVLTIRKSSRCIRLLPTPPPRLYLSSRPLVLHTFYSSEDKSGNQSYNRKIRRILLFPQSFYTLCTVFWRAPVTEIEGARAKRT
jgi:hypothetical protein